MRKSITNLPEKFSKFRLVRFLCLIPVLIFGVIFSSCEDDDIFTIQQYALPVPGSSPTIDRNQLVSGGSFNVGYANGNIRSKSVRLSWQKSNDLNFLAYKILRNGVPIKIFSDIQKTSFIDSSLWHNTYYKYTIATLSDAGTHKLDTITIKTPRFDTPLLNFQIRSATSLRVFWNKSTESATAYILEKSTTFNPYNFQKIATPSDTFFIDNNVTNGTMYAYRISAINAFESTAVSSPYTITVNYVMNAPSLLPLQQLFPTRRVQLSWSDNSTAEEGFKIYRRRGLSGNYSLIGNVSTNITSYIDADTTALQIDTTYYYYVQGFNQQDTTGRSTVRSITITTSTIILNEGFESGTLPSGWSTGGNANWYVSSSQPYSGSYSARSGVISHSQYTYLQRTVSFTGTRTISFYYRVSSESCCDKLRFYINSILYGEWGGETGWQYYSTTFNGSGSVILRWEYSKDGSVSQGSDAAWIDNVVVN